MTARPTSGVFTTGQVARICKVAPRTVSKWFDRGQLRGYKIPGSRDRRIPARELVAFMKQHGMPTDELDAAGGVTLLLARPGSRADQIAATLSASGEVARAGTLFEAGLLAERLRPRALVIDADDFAEQLAGCIEAIRAATGSGTIVTVGTTTCRLGDRHVSDPADRSALLGAVSGLSADATATSASLDDALTPAGLSITRTATSTATGTLIGAGT